MPSPILTEVEREDARQRREYVGCFVKTYRESASHDPRDAKISPHIVCQGQHDVVSWVNHGDHHRDNVLARKGLQLIESVNANRYHCVVVKTVGTFSILNIVEVVTQANFMVGNSPDWAILLIGLNEGVCGSFEGYLVPLYGCLFTRLGTCLPFSDFKMAMMNHLKVSHHSFILELWPS